MEATALTPSQSTVYAECKSQIRKGIETFMDVGNALWIVKNDGLYLSEFATFDDFCKSFKGFTASRAYRLMAACEVGKTLLPNGQQPTNERQCRELAKLPADEQAEAWAEVLATTTNPKARDVEAVVSRRLAEHAEPEADEGEQKQPPEPLGESLFGGNESPELTTDETNSQSRARRDADPVPGISNNVASHWHNAEWHLGEAQQIYAAHAQECNERDNVLNTIRLSIQHAEYYRRNVEEA